MMLLLFICIAITICLGPLYLFRLSRIRSCNSIVEREISNWPHVDILLPLHNEEQWISRKLDNLKTLDYPSDRLTIWIIDGCSNDGTVEIVEKQIERQEGFQFLRLKISNKTAQLNEALKRVSGKWIMVTDADAQLSRDTLKRMIMKGENDPALGVLGTPVKPYRAHWLEMLHWKFFTQLWQYESTRGFASLVTAPCYIFRRDLLVKFPSDTIGDDVYITFLAAEKNMNVQIVDSLTTELRSPSTVYSLFRHKLRKADAYLREIFRFLPRFQEMALPARAIFLWRAAQLTLLPFAVAGMVISSLFLALSIFQTMELRMISLILIAGSTVLILLRWILPGLLQSVVYVVFISFILVYGLLIHPFSRQTAKFPKVSESLLNNPSL